MIFLTELKVANELVIREKRPRKYPRVHERVKFYRVPG